MPSQFSDGLHTGHSEIVAMSFFSRVLPKPRSLISIQRNQKLFLRCSRTFSSIGLQLSHICRPCFSQCPCPGPGFKQGLFRSALRMIAPPRSLLKTLPFFASRVVHPKSSFEAALGKRMIAHSHNAALRGMLRSFPFFIKEV